MPQFSSFTSQRHSATACQRLMRTVNGLSEAMREPLSRVTTLVMISLSWLSFLAGVAWPLTGLLVPVSLVRWSVVPLLLEALNLVSRQSSLGFVARCASWLPLSLALQFLPPFFDTFLTIVATATGVLYYSLTAFFVVYALVATNRKLIGDFEDQRPAFVMARAI